jgi:hypothetical protein
METPTFLYKPNFCAECGEKIERESWHFWTSRSFCENCEPVFRANRIVPVAFLGIALFVTGMFFGQAGQETRKPVSTLSTQSAALIEKPQPAPSKQLAAANQPIQTQNLPAEQTQPGNSAPAVAVRPAANALPARAAPEAVYTCGARTQKGTPCSRRVKAAGTRCWQHLGKPSMLEKNY